MFLTGPSNSLCVTTFFFFEETQNLTYSALEGKWDYSRKNFVQKGKDSHISGKVEILPLKY